jgi:UDP-GlcNAc3NAcA epimerase
LQAIIKALNALDRQIIFPIHPRTKKALKEQHVQLYDHVTVIDPVGYFDMLRLEKNAKAILTDSGGIQKEAYFFSIPCITLREETEWVETVAAGWNILTGSDPDKIITAAENVTRNKEHPDLFGDGKASQNIVDLISKYGDQH